MELRSHERAADARSPNLPRGGVREAGPAQHAMASSDVMGTPAPSAGADIQADRDQAGEGPRILLVEDSFMLVCTLELAFANFGWTMVGPATRLPKALAMARTETFDAVLLDVNLGGFMSWDVASALKARGIPFVLSTGYELGELLPDSLKGSPFIRKPYSIDHLQTSILNLLALRPIV